MIYDLDGTFSEGLDGATRPSARIIAYYRHLRFDCSVTTNSFTWDNAMVCNDSVPLRKISIKGVQDSYEFKGTAMKIQIISDIMEEVPEDTTDFTAVRSTLAGK